MLELGGRGALAGALRRGVHEKNDAVGIRERGGLQQDRVDHGEDGGIGADAEGQRGDRGGREAGL